MTLPEGLLWRELRNAKLAGLKFRRQHPFGPYIFDFYCDERKLAVEIDGAWHEQPDQIRHDERRTAFLVERGLIVHRIAAIDVLKNLEGALHGIKTIAGRL
jgi:very-short-patch-repair endonuclease